MGGPTHSQKCATALYPITSASTQAEASLNAWLGHGPEAPVEDIWVNLSDRQHLSQTLRGYFRTCRLACGRAPHAWRRSSLPIAGSAWKRRTAPTGCCQGRTSCFATWPVHMAT